MRKDNLSISQVIVLHHIDQGLAEMIGNLMHFVQSVPQMVTAVEESELPLNTAHLRAAGLSVLDGVEQTIQSLSDDGRLANDEEVQDMLEGIQEVLDECREDLTQVD